MSIVFPNMNKPLHCDQCPMHSRYQNLWSIYCNATDRKLVDDWEGNPDIMIEVPEWCPAIDFDLLTVYGYAFNDILAFADACRISGVRNEDLKDFVKCTEQMYDTFAKKLDEQLGKQLKEWLGGKEENNASH